MNLAIWTVSASSGISWTATAERGIPLALVVACVLLYLNFRRPQG